MSGDEAVDWGLHVLRAARSRHIEDEYRMVDALLVANIIFGVESLLHIGSDGKGNEVFSTERAGVKIAVFNDCGSADYISYYLDLGGYDEPSAFWEDILIDYISDKYDEYFEF